MTYAEQFADLFEEDDEPTGSCGGIASGSRASYTGASAQQVTETSGSDTAPQCGPSQSATQAVQGGTTDEGQAADSSEGEDWGQLLAEFEATYPDACLNEFPAWARSRVVIPTSKPAVPSILDPSLDLKELRVYNEPLVQSMIYTGEENFDDSEGERKYSFLEELWESVQLGTNSKSFGPHREHLLSIAGCRTFGIRPTWTSVSPRGPEPYLYLSKPPTPGLEMSELIREHRREKEGKPSLSRQTTKKESRSHLRGRRHTRALTSNEVHEGKEEGTSSEVCAPSAAQELDIPSWDGESSQPHDDEPVVTMPQPEAPPVSGEDDTQEETQELPSSPSSSSESPDFDGPDAARDQFLFMKTNEYLKEEGEKKLELKGAPLFSTERKKETNDSELVDAVRAAWDAESHQERLDFLSNHLKALKLYDAAERLRYWDSIWIADEETW